MDLIYGFLGRNSMIKAFQLKVPKKQSGEAMKIIKLVKTHYLLE